MTNTGSENAGKKVIIGLTGRTASCVAAFLLKKQGFEVIGVSIITNIDDNFQNLENAPKCHIQNIEGIKKFCESLKIPFYATDSKAQFEDEVMDPLVAHKLGAFANTSCFNCTEMRIKILFEKMKLLEADFIATGHFCKVHQNMNTDQFYVHSNSNPESDQSFLLSGIDNKYLRHLLLPLGELRTIEVNKIAQKFNLNIVNKPKAHSFCFTEKSSFVPYLEAVIPKDLKREGQVENVDTELLYGDHEGVIYHSVTDTGLKFKGISPNDDRIEVVGYDFEKGILKVGSKEHLSFNGVHLTKLKMNAGIDRRRPMQCFFKTKYSSQFLKCSLYFKNNESALVEFEARIYPIIIGENIVLFDKDGRNSKVIGHGVVTERGGFELINRARVFQKESAKPVKPKTFKF